MKGLSRSRAGSAWGWRWTAVVLVGSWIPAGPALAHGSLAIGEFYTGMLHPLLHLETLLPTLALALWCGQLEAPRAAALALVFLGAAVAGAAAGLLELDLLQGRALLRLSMLVLGLLAATRGRLPLVIAIGLVLVFGVYSGQANTYEPGRPIERPLLFVLGLTSCVGLVLFHVATRIHRHRAFWVQTGARVVGSWIAATGLLVLVLEWTVEG